MTRYELHVTVIYKITGMLYCNNLFLLRHGQVVSQPAPSSNSAEVYECYVNLLLK